MNEPLTFTERGGVAPKVVPVADLIINPQRGYSADSPSNAEFINLREDPAVLKAMNDNLTLREKGINPPKV